MRRLLRAVAAVAVVQLVAGASPSAAAGATAALPARPSRPAVAHAVPPAVAYRPPVDAPVTDAFRPPATPFGPGNRGFEYATARGTPVRAAADGRVVFAGPVAGELHVVILHADGIRTSYSFLAEVAVATGATLRQGDVVGTTGARLFFGARMGDVYVDPAGLLVGGAAGRVHLAPLEPGGPSPDDARALARVVADGGTATADALAWLRRAGAPGERSSSADGRGGASAAWRAVVHELASLDVVHRLVATVATVGRWRAGRRWCTPDRRAPPRVSARRVAVLVGGLGSSSADAAVDAVDVAALGYAPTDVVRFSYAGGRVPDPADGFPTVPAAPYASAHSQRDLGASADALVELLRAVATAAPGVPIDVIAHSQGGVVGRLALDRLAREGTGAAGMPAVLATIGSPHEGADLATAVAAARLGPGGTTVLEILAATVPVAIDPDAPALAQLAETAAPALGLAGWRAPPGVRVVSIAARGDPVVPSVRSDLPGVPTVVVPAAGPTAHDRLPGLPAVTRELALAIGGRPPTCTTVADLVRDVLVAEALSWAQDGLGLAGAVAGLVTPAAGSP